MRCDTYVEREVELASRIPPFVPLLCLHPPHFPAQRHKDHHAKLQALNGDLQMARSDVERQTLGLGAGSIEEMTPAQILEVASKTQDESMASVQRMQRKIGDSKQVGAETAAKLRQQTEQLKNIDSDIMKVKSNLNRADVLVRAFIRKMVTDKIIMIFVCAAFDGSKHGARGRRGKWGVRP
jgi:hypothetical protein